MKIIATFVVSIFLFFQQDCEQVPPVPAKNAQQTVVKRGTIQKVITAGGPGRYIGFPSVVIKTETGVETIALNSTSAIVSPDGANSRLIMAMGCIGKDREIEITLLFDGSVLTGGDHWDASSIVCVVKD